MSLLNSREEKDEEQGLRALKRYGPGNLSGELNEQNYGLKSSIFQLPFSFEPMGADFGNFKDGGVVTPKGAMQFKGHGTGKSDSIDAKLKVEGVVLPIETVQKYGADKLKAIMDLFDPESTAEDMSEGQEEVKARVSNGEIWVPPEVTRQTGADFWTALIASSTGTQPQPEMGAHGEMMAAGGGLMDERMAAQQFWKNAPSTPVPIPGRANPPNPADLMTDRLNASANIQAQQAPSLRSQMANQGQSLTQQSTPVQSTQQIPTYKTPEPHNNFLKNASNMMNGEGAIATGMAFDVLNRPQNVNQVNGAISSLKQRAGIDQSSTPYPSLKNMNLGYAKGGEVKGYAGGGGIYDEEERKKLKAAGQNFTQETGNVVNTLAKPVDAAGRIIKGTGTALANTADLYQRGGGMLGGLKNVAENVGNIGATGLKTIGAAGNTILTGAPFPSANELAKPTFGFNTQAPSLKQAVPSPAVQTPVQPQQTQAPSVQTPQNPVQGALPPTIGKASNWSETGYRTDDAPQTLAWNESRWSNSGDPVQDAALAERRGANASLRAQANLMNQYPEIAGALNPGAAVLPQSLAHDTKFNNDSLAARKEFANSAPVNRDYSPAFSNEELADLPEGAGFQDRQRLVTMPKQAWQQFNLDLANENDQKGVESRIQMFAKASGISPDVIKYKLGLSQ